MKVVSLSIIALSLFFSLSNAFAKETVLMVSIDKKVVAPSEIQDALDALNFRDVTMSNCYVTSDVMQYIDYDAMPTAPKNIPYYGVALLRFQWECDNHARNILTQWQDSLKYTIWSNASIGPWPAVSGSN